MQIERIAQYKIEVEGLSWEDNPVIANVECPGMYDDAAQAASLFAIELSRLVKREIRWSFDGASQGHYIQAR